MGFFFLVMAFDLKLSCVEVTFSFISSTKEMRKSRLAQKTTERDFQIYLNFPSNTNCSWCDFVRLVIESIYISMDVIRKYIDNVHWNTKTHWNILKIYVNPKTSTSYFRIILDHHGETFAALAKLGYIKTWTKVWSCSKSEKLGCQAALPHMWLHLLSPCKIIYRDKNKKKNEWNLQFFLVISKLSTAKK